MTIIPNQIYKVNYLEISIRYNFSRSSFSNQNLNNSKNFQFCIISKNKIVAQTISVNTHFDLKKNE